MPKKPEINFDCLSDAEKEIVYWLAINREPVSVSKLKGDILSPESKYAVPTTVNSLQEKLPLVESERVVENDKNEKCYTLEDNYIKYITEHLIDQLFQEIKKMEFNLFKTHPILKAIARDDIRDSQYRHIVKPLYERLENVFGGKQGVENHLKQLLLSIKGKKLYLYAAGNILNLLCHMKSDISKFDFTEQIIWQAYLQGMRLRDVNFSYSDFSNFVFTQTFGDILTIAFNNYGSYFATGESDGYIRIWNPVHLTSLQTIKGHANSILSLAFSPDDQILASAGDDNLIKIWDIHTSKHIKSMYDHSNAVNSVVFSHNGETLASGADDHTVRIWDINSGRCIKSIDAHESEVLSVAYSPDDKIIASVSHNNTVKIWDAKTGDIIKTLQEHNYKIRTVAFGKDGKVLTGCGYHNKVILWDIKDSDNISHLKTINRQTDKVCSVAISPDCKR